MIEPVSIALTVAGWLISKLISQLLDGDVEKWAMFVHIGDEVVTLKKKVHEVAILLENAKRSDLKNWPLLQSLTDLQQAAYDTEDLLKELDYYRLQDTVEKKNVHRKYVSQPAPNKVILAGRYVSSTVQVDCHSAHNIIVRKHKPSIPKLVRKDILKRIKVIVKSLEENGEVVNKALSLENLGRIAEALTPENLRKFTEELSNKVNTTIRPDSQHGSAGFETSKPNENTLAVKPGSQHGLAMFEPSSGFESSESNGNITTKPDSQHVLAMLESSKPNKKTTIKADIEHSTPVFEPSKSNENSTIKPDHHHGPAISEPPKSNGNTGQQGSVFGRETEENEIVKLLRTDDNSGEGNIWVLSIAGIGGTGKTTLAKLVYYNKEVVECFGDKRMWIHVSANMDVKSFTQKIVNILSNDERESGIKGDLEDQHAIIRTKLENKKVLLVVDNFCSERSNGDLWNCLSKLFRGTRKNGTKILVTTRNTNFAKDVSTAKCIKLERLTRKAKEQLFDACSFQDENPDNYQALLKLREDFLKKLYGYPLEVKTIGVLLRKKLDFDHWNMVLNNDEWKNLNNTDGSEHIMSSLKISYQFLSSELQKCFSYCSLFPKNFKFKGDDLIYLWMAQGFVYSKNGYKSKLLGLEFLNELVGWSFLEEVKENVESKKIPMSYYVMHELVHDLAKLISSKEILTIDGSDVRTSSNSIRHVSIITHSAYGYNNMEQLNKKTYNTIENFENKMVEIVKNLDITKLRTLILIGNYNSKFAKTFENLFKKAKYLRVLRLSMECFVVDSLLCNFSNSLLLHYLKLDKSRNDPSESLIEYMTNNRKKSNKKVRKLVYRLYHLETLDLSDWYGDLDLSGITKRLISLRRFYAQDAQLTKISEIGKLTRLEELPKFIVQNKKGFGIGQLGKLTELGGSLSILNLEDTNSVEDAKEANLASKSELRNLSLSWGSKSYSYHHSPLKILECLEPPPHIRNLDINGYPDTDLTSWINKYHFTECLGSLSLIDCINLKILPPLGQLPVLEKLEIKGLHNVEKVTEKFYGDNARDAFRSLKEMVFSDMSSWVEWVGSDGPDGYQMFPSLQKLEILCCQKLHKLPKQFASSKIKLHFRNLMELRVESCPKVELPSLPHRPKLNNILISDGLYSVEKLSLSQPPSGLSLSVKFMAGRTLYEKILVFSNLKTLAELSIKGCSIACLPWEGFKELGSLKRLIIKDLVQNTQNSGKWVLPESLELLDISSKYVTGQHVSNWLLKLPSLLTLVVTLPEIDSLEVKNEKITMEVQNKQTTSKENSWAGEAKLCISPLLLASLKEINLIGCNNLVSLFLPQNGLSKLTSLQKLIIKSCPKLQLSKVGNKESDEICILPSGLLQLEIDWLPENKESLFLSNLTNLTQLKLDSIVNLKSLSMDHFAALQELNIENCINLSTLEGVGKLQSLRILKIVKCQNMAVAWKNALKKEENINESLRLEELITDDTSFLTDEICKYLSTLKKMVFYNVEVIEFTNQHQKSLLMLTTVGHISFQNCSKLQSLPKLGPLRALSMLEIKNCLQIKLLSDDQLPDSIEVTVDKSNKQLIQCCEKLRKIKKLYSS